jgi:hypothetical protein
LPSSVILAKARVRTEAEFPYRRLHSSSPAGTGFKLAYSLGATPLRTHAG